jgi:uncharacterized protein YjbI with pentapeptide repeats
VNEPQVASRRPQFSLRSALVGMLLVALACGWYASVRRESAIPSAASIDSGESAFQRASFSGGRMRGAILRGDVSTFQLATFDGADLAGARLTASGASFQHATFARCDLSRAALSGSHSSFQLASFAGCDLSRAVLAGDHSAFQATSFQGARLLGAKLRGGGQSFQGIEIDQAQFRGADLSQLDSGTLASWSFNSPPIYDELTRFPAGFDPAAHKWERAAQDSQLPSGQ